MVRPILKQIENNVALNFLKENEAEKEYIIIKNKDKWFGLFLNNKLIGCWGVEIKKTYIKFGGFFILKEERGKGYGKLLAKYLIDLYGNKKIIAYCSPTTTHINCKYFNFKIVKKYKNTVCKIERKGI